MTPVLNEAPQGGFRAVEAALVEIPCHIHRHSAQAFPLIRSAASWMASAMRA